MKATVGASVVAGSILLIAAGISTGQPAQRGRKKSPAEYTFEIVSQFPHDPGAFTQGLTYHNGYFYEGTGLNGRSSLRQVRLETGEVIRKVDLAPELFGEGITVVGDRVIHLPGGRTLDLCMTCETSIACGVSRTAGRAGV